MRPFYLLLALFLSTLPSLAQTTNAPTSDAPLPDQHSMAFNTAIVPAPKVENDNYDWWKRHAAILAGKDSIHPQIVLIGDSITHRWGGPFSTLVSAGPNAWKEAFGDLPVLNLGFGFDRTQNVLWRLDHGEFDGLAPKWVVINIGSNNLLPTRNARGNTPQEIVDGIMAVCNSVHAKSPTSKIILMAVFPRDAKPNGPHRLAATVVNQILATNVKTHPELTYLDIGAQFLEPDGTLPVRLMGDGTHPTDEGYSIWAKALVAAGVRD